MRHRAVLSFMGILVLHAAFSAVAAEPAGQSRSNREQAPVKPDVRMPASALHERNSLANPEDLSERLKAAQAYVLESQDSPSKLNAALGHLDAVLQAEPRNVDAHLLAAQIELMRGKPIVA